MVAQPPGDHVKMLRVSVAKQPDLRRCQLPVFLLADGPDPFPRVEAHSSHTTFGILLGMGQANKLDGRHATLYILEVVDCQVMPLLLKVLKDQPSVAMLGGRLAAQQDGGNRKNRLVEDLFDAAVLHQS